MPGSFVHGSSFCSTLGCLNWWLRFVWALGRGATEVHCGFVLDLSGLIHTWLPTFMYVCMYVVNLVWSSIGHIEI